MVMNLSRIAEPPYSVFSPLTHPDLSYLFRILIEMETMIEFAHRVTSGFALIAVVALVIWSIRIFQKGHTARHAAFLSWSPPSKAFRPGNRLR